jgi:hypothetical protein
MAQISGIPVENIINMYGIDAATIVLIGGIPTTSIPGWPSGGGCETLSLGFTSRLPTQQACINPRNDYQFDSINNILYAAGELCGGRLAPDGFYSDGMLTYKWFKGIWGVGGLC